MTMYCDYVWGVQQGTAGRSEHTAAASAIKQHLPAQASTGHELDLQLPTGSPLQKTLLHGTHLAVLWELRSERIVVRTCVRDSVHMDMAQLWKAVSKCGRSTDNPDSTECEVTNRKRS